jgi:hypothetical protein
MNITYHSPLIRQLRDQQVRVASRDKKLEHVNRAEKLLAEVESGRSYPYEYLCYRITEYRPDTAANVAVAGKDVAHDRDLVLLDVRGRVLQLARVQVALELCEHGLVGAEIPRNDAHLGRCDPRARPRAGDLGLPATALGLESAREAREGLAAEQVVDELGRRLRLDAVVGRDPVATVDLAAGIGQLGIPAALAATRNWMVGAVMKVLGALRSTPAPRA